MKACRLTTAVVAAFLAVADVANAAEGAHGHGESEIPLTFLLFSTINLLIFLFILNRYAVPSIRQFVRERRNNIITDLEEAAKARGEAMRLKAEWEERLGKLDETMQQMREQAKQDSERERERILADAHRVAEAIHRDAERTVAAELRAMQIELRGQVVRESIQVAEGEIRRSWTDADQQRFIDEFVQQVER